MNFSICVQLQYTKNIVKVMPSGFIIHTALHWWYIWNGFTVCTIVKCFLPIIIIPLIQFSSLARPINFQWHLSKWSKWNDCFLSFVQCVRHYVTFVGSLPYLEPIIWWVGRQPTSGEIRVLKSIGREKHGWCLHSIWQKWTVSLWMGKGEVVSNVYSLQDQILK